MVIEIIKKTNSSEIQIVNFRGFLEFYLVKMWIFLIFVFVRNFESGVNSLYLSYRRGW